MSLANIKRIINVDLVLNIKMYVSLLRAVEGLSLGRYGNGILCLNLA